MADLPLEKLYTSPPFSYVGLDVFGPWTVVTRRTRGSAARSKRWAILFTCINMRGVHIEIIESLHTHTFHTQQLRSDRGTNFIAASAELGMRSSDENQNSIRSYFHSKVVHGSLTPHMHLIWEACGNV